MASEDLVVSEDSVVNEIWAEVGRETPSPFGRAAYAAPLVSPSSLNPCRSSLRLAAAG